MVVQTASIHYITYTQYTHTCSGVHETGSESLHDVLPVDAMWQHRLRPNLPCNCCVHVVLISNAHTWMHSSIPVLGSCACPIAGGSTIMSYTTPDTIIKYDTSTTANTIHDGGGSIRNTRATSAATGSAMMINRGVDGLL